MKKTIILLTFVFLLSFLFSEHKGKKEISSQLDFKKIILKHHTKQLEENSNYLETLNVAELFEFVYELALFDTMNAVSNWMIIISPLQRIIKENDNSDLFIECLKYDFNNSDFRYFLLDISSKEIKKENSSFNKLQDMLLKIAKSNEENIELRRSAILDLKSKDEKYQKALSELFIELDEDKLRGAVITKMRRNQHPELQDFVLPILTNHQDYKKEILYPAISASNKKNIGLLGKIARETLYPMTYQKCLNQFGILNTPEAVIECIKSLGRFSDDEFVNRNLSISRYLWNSQTAIESMLGKNETDKQKIFALQAIRFAKMPFGEDLTRRIEIIKTTAGNIELKKECQLTLIFLTEYKKSDRFVKDNRLFKIRYSEEFNK